MRSGTLARSAADSALATLVPTPHAEPGELIGHLLAGLRDLPDQLVLVLDDVQHLRSAELVAELERLVTGAPPRLRIVLLSRRDPKLGLHRLRLAGQLTEIRAADLEFTTDEAAELLEGAGVSVGTDEIASLRERTEGWATGLRLAAMSLSRHQAPSQFVAEFAGSERTIADYLLAEVLARQPAEVRDLLLRTCILDGVNGELADLLTGRTDGDRVLHELAEANALVVATDVARTWFRYHHLLLDLLRLELQARAPGRDRRAPRPSSPVVRREGTASRRDPARPTERRLGPGLRAARPSTRCSCCWTARRRPSAACWKGYPSRSSRSDAEVATMLAAEQLRLGHWAEGEALLESAQETMADVPAARRGRAEIALTTAQLFRARQIGGVEDIVDEATAVLDQLGTAGPGGADLEGLARLNLGVAQAWTLRFAEAERNLEHGLALGRTIGRPYVEIGCLTALGNVAILTERNEVGARLLRGAIDVAERVGWTTHPLVGPAYMGLAATLIDHGVLAEGEQWLDRADPILARAPEPAASIGQWHTRGLLEMCRGRFGDALTAFREGERLVDVLHAPHVLGFLERPWQLRARLGLGRARCRP